MFDMADEFIEFKPFEKYFNDKNGLLATGEISVAREFTKNEGFSL